MTEPGKMHVFDPKEHTLEGRYARGTREYDEALWAVTFSPDDLERAHAVRIWHPYYRDGLSSFIYHYHDLLDAGGAIVARHSTRRISAKGREARWSSGLMTTP